MILFPAAVSSMAGTPIPVDDYGIDVCLAGLQKAFALPAGLAVAAVSERAIERARGIENRNRCVQHNHVTIFASCWLDRCNTVREYRWPVRHRHTGAAI